MVFIPSSEHDRTQPKNVHLHHQQQQQQHSLFSQASWGRLEMKPERNKFKVQAQYTDYVHLHQG